MTPEVKKKAEDLASSDEWANKMFPCKPPCNSYGVCGNCLARKVFDVGYTRGFEAGYNMGNVDAYESAASMMRKNNFRRNLDWPEFFESLADEYKVARGEP